MSHDVRSFSTPADLSDAAAHAIADLIRSHTEDRPFRLSLAGGSTPKPVYERLATLPDVPWERVHLFWSDERFVPDTSADNNYRMVQETLLAHIDLPNDQVHPIPTSLSSAEEASGHYETTLRFHLPDADGPTFDLSLLGLGSDGHTASLFPDDAALQVADQWVCAVDAPASMRPTERVTLTYPVLNRSVHAFFLVQGARKRDALRGVLGTDGTPNASLPATHIRALRGVTWFVDHAALGTKG